VFNNCRCGVEVHWTESRSTGTRLGAYTEHYNAEVEYFFKRQVLFGGGQLCHSCHCVEDLRLKMSDFCLSPVDGTLLADYSSWYTGGVLYKLKSTLSDAVSNVRNV